MQFHGWLVSRLPLSTADVHEAPLRDKIEDEKEMKMLKCHRSTGPPNDESRVAIDEDRVRQKVTPRNGGPVRFGNCQVLRTYEEPTGRRTVKLHSVTHEIEDKIVERQHAHSVFGFSSHRNTHYDIVRKKWLEQWTVTTDIDGKVTETKPERVGNVTEWKVDSGRERGWTEGHHRVLSETRPRTILFICRSAHSSSPKGALQKVGAGLKKPCNTLNVWFTF
jgi:hypothetical protein